MSELLGTIPQSSALAEATTDSLSELFSRDPEGLSRIDINKMIEAMRAHRVKWAAGEVEKAKSGPKVLAKTIVQATSASMDDILA